MEKLKQKKSIFKHSKCISEKTVAIKPTTRWGVRIDSNSNYKNYVEYLFVDPIAGFNQESYDANIIYSFRLKLVRAQRRAWNVSPVKLKKHVDLMNENEQHVFNEVPSSIGKASKTTITKLW